MHNKGNKKNNTNQDFTRIMERYEATKYYVKWQGGAGWYYPDAQFLDVTREEGEALTPEMSDKIAAMCAKYHRRAMVSDFRALIIVISSIVLGACLVGLLK